MITIAYDAVRGEGALRAFGSPALPDRYAMRGLDFRDGLFAGMIRSEVLAATAGVVPYVDLGNGQRGVTTIGEARGILSSPGRWAIPGGRAPSGRDLTERDRSALSTVYLAQQGACRAATGYARRPSASAPLLELTGILPPGSDLALASWSFGLVPPDAELTLAPLVTIVLGAVAVAALVAGAWYAVETHRIDVETERRRVSDVARTASLTELAQRQLATTGEIDPSIVDALGSLGTDERRSSWAMPLLLGTAGLGAGAGVVLGVRQLARGRRARG